MEARLMRRAALLFAALAVACDPSTGVRTYDAGTSATRDAGPAVDATIIVSHRLGASGPQPFAPKYQLTPPAVDAQSFVGYRDGAVGWYPGPSGGGTGSLDGAVTSVTGTPPLVATDDAGHVTVTAECDAGQVPTGIDGGKGTRCALPNVTNVTGSAPVSCINSAGVVTCGLTGTGYAASVSGATGVSCSPTTGAVSCGLTAPVSIANGGTGTTTAPSSAQVMIAQSSSAYAPETLSGDCTTSNSGVVTCNSLGSGVVAYSSSSGGSLSVSTRLVFNQPLAGNGAVSGELSTQTTNATPNTSMALPVSTCPGTFCNISGTVTILVQGKVPSSATAVAQTFTGYLTNNAGTVAMMTTQPTFSPGVLASTGTVATTPISVALSAGSLVITVTGTTSTTWNWSATAQVAMAGP